MPSVYFNAARLTRLLDGWAGGSGPVSNQLVEAVRHHVRSGELPAGVRLPSERQLAAALGIARTTVSKVFDTLRDDGILVSRTGVGTFVSAAGLRATARGDDRLRSFAHEHSSARIDLRSAALPGVPFVGEELARQSLDDFAGTLTTHGYVAAGLPILRAAVARYYTDLGLRTDPAEILVTSGAQQAIRVLAQALLEPGQTVLLENPTYRGMIEVMRFAGVRVIGIPSGRDGVDVDALGDIARKHKARLALLQSTVQNPSGSVLPARLRPGVAAISAELGLTIVDHLAAMDALIDGAIPPPLATYGGNVLTVGSSSKAFWGGLRVGWIRADMRTVEQLAVVKSAEDLGTSIPSQVVTARLLERIDEARAYRQSTLAAARAFMLQALAERLPAWKPLCPAGGASMWIQIPEGYSATALAETAGRAGVDVLPGPTFSCRDDLDDWLRVSFAAPPAELAAGLDRLASAWQAMSDHTPRRTAHAR